MRSSLCADVVTARNQEYETMAGKFWADAMFSLRPAVCG